MGIKQLERQLTRLKTQEARDNKLARTKAEIREVKYGRYFKPGRKVVAYMKKKARKMGGNDMFGGDLGLGGGNILGGGGSGPLSDIGSGFGGISMGNPFGETAARRHIKHHRKPKVRIIYRTRPRRRRYYYR